MDYVARTDAGRVLREHCPDGMPIVGDWRSNRDRIGNFGERKRHRGASAAPMFSRPAW
ncbi:hypothetical protein [Mycobacterium saskatchewanense]|nr:hypothetical protein [Mycobacterium saskatchewanense]